MKMRMPSIPLITVDPYFSVWTDNINKHTPVHWTGHDNTIVGTVLIDGEKYRFLGDSDDNAMTVVSVDADTFSTVAVFEDAGIRLTAKFTSPMLVTDLYYASRPVSYLKLSYEALDGKEHLVRAKVSVSEELVLNKAGEGRAWSESVKTDELTWARMGKGNQKILWRSGDDVRIDWGYFYLAVKGEAETGNEVLEEDLYAVFAETELDRDLEMLQTNIVALHTLTKLFLPDMLRRNRGRILNVASLAGFMSGPLMGAYYASKAYVLRLSRAISKEVK